MGEVYLLETSAIRAYYGQRDELHLAFNFLPLSIEWTAAAWRELIETVERELRAGAWPTWVLSNHDTRRHRTRLGGDERRAGAAAVLLLTLRGTPFLYQGEELGLEDADVPEERRIDPGGRDGCRAPIPWTPDPGHGWPVEEHLAAVAARGRPPQRRVRAERSAFDASPLSRGAHRAANLAGAPPGGDPGGAVP